MAPVTLAVVPSATPGNSRVALDAVCDALGTILGSPVVAATPDSYPALADALLRDRVQYAWMSPALMVLTEERIRLRPLLSAVRGDRTDYCAALFVAAERSLHDVADLRGMRVAWVDHASASGYLCPRISLAARGLDPDAFFGEELFLRSHAEVVRAVLDGRADVGATYAERPAPGQPIRRAGFLDVAPERSIRVLEWTRPIPNDVIVGHGLLSFAEHRAFGDAMLELSARAPGRKLLFNAFHAEHFVTTPRHALRPLFELVKSARANGLLRQL